MWEKGSGMEGDARERTGSSMTEKGGVVGKWKGLRSGMAVELWEEWYLGKHSKYGIEIFGHSFIIHLHNAHYIIKKPFHSIFFTRKVKYWLFH